MKRREDWEILKKLKKIGVDINDLASKPLLVLKKNDEMQTEIDKFNKINGFENEVRLDVLFKHLTTHEMLNSIGDSFLLLSSDYYQKESLCLINYHIKSRSFEVTLLAISGEVGDAVIIMRVDELNVTVSQVDYDKARGIAQYKLNEFDKIIEVLAKYAGTKIGVIIPLFNILKNSDLYPVETKNTSPKKIKPHVAKTKPWIREDLVSIVFLNQLPREQAESKGGHHVSPRYHHRRGAWVHLRNERYKNHPKYGDKIYRKASWVGEREAIVNGTTYKVL